MKKALVIVLLLAAPFARAAHPPVAYGPAFDPAPLVIYRRTVKRQISNWIYGLGAVSKSGKTPPSRAQATKILAQLALRQRQPRLSEAEAQKLHAQLNAILNKAQQDEVNRYGSGYRPVVGGSLRDISFGLDEGPATLARIQRVRRQMEAIGRFVKIYNPCCAPTAYQDFNDLPEPLKERYKKRFEDQQAALAQVARRAKE